MSDPIRDWIVAKLNSVANIGVVHPYQRYAAREKQLADLYVYQGQLRGWFVYRQSVVETNVAASNHLETTRWLIRGYLALEDETQTELDFDGLLDEIRAVFRIDESFGNELINGEPLILTTPEQAGFAVLESMPVLFAGVLCHSARCQVITQRWIGL